MKRAVLFGVVLFAAAPHIAKAGPDKPNFVQHFNHDGTYKFLDLSQGNCIRHIENHPQDLVYPGDSGGVHDSGACQ